MPQLDPDDEQFKYQMEMANALRGRSMDTGGEMRGRIFVRKSPWENLMQGLAGGYMGSKALAERQALEGQRQQEVQNWLGQVPGASTQQEITGPPQPGQTMPTVNIPKDPRQLASEMQQWGMRGAQLKSPLAQSVAQQSIQHALTMPEKEAERRMQGEIAQQQILTRALEARQTKEEADARRAEERALDRENQRILRGMMASQGAANADIDRQIKEMRLEEMRAKRDSAAVAGPKLSSADQKALSASDDIISKVQNARKLLEATPSAMGLKTLVPDIALQRVSSPEERMTRAAVGELAAEKAHELYGAAFSGAEQKRANKFLPADGDLPETVLEKLAGLEAMALEKANRLRGIAPPPVSTDASTPAPAKVGGGTRKKYNPETGMIE